MSGRNGAGVNGGGSPLSGSPHALINLPHSPRSFLIGEDGLVYEGRGWNTKGDHAGRFWNPMSIGITFMGNYMGECPASQDRERTWALGDGTEQCVVMETDCYL